MYPSSLNYGRCFPLNLRPTRYEVYLENLRHNFDKIKSFVGPRVQVMSVVKANGYGMGIVPIAKALEEAGCQRFAVATPDEAVALREAGIEEPLLVLGPSPIEAAGYYVDHDVAAALTDMDFACAASRVAEEKGKVARLHVKIDTGMGRIGFLPEELPYILPKLKGLPCIDIEGVFTHFATADESNLEYSRWQFRRFMKALDILADFGIKVRLRHVCNSAGILNLPEYHLDAVRPGLILYGMWPSDSCRKPFDLKKVFQIKTEVAALRTLPLGSGVGYGLRYMTRGEEKIAVLPVGYHDGYPRVLSMRASVLIKGIRAPIVGNICMDQMMVNVTHIPDVKVKDEVVLIGAQGDEKITPEEIAKIIGTINYEVPNLFTPRVPRVYL